MLKYRLLHPELLRALGEAGHGARVLLADGNYPLATRSPERARRVYLNLAPDLLRVTDVLAVLVDAIPVEAAHVMTPGSGDEPPVFGEFRLLLPGVDLSPLSGSTSTTPPARLTSPSRSPPASAGFVRQPAAHDWCRGARRVARSDRSDQPPRTLLRGSLMPTVNTTGRFVGDWPKIGIRPTIDGRYGGVRESLEGQTMAMARAHGGPLREHLRHAGRPAGRVRDRGHLHRRRPEAASARRSSSSSGRRRLAHRHALLVLRLRDDGHGPAICRRRSGASTAPSGPARSTSPPCSPATPRRACPPSASTARDVQDASDTEIPADVQRQAACASPAPGWPSPSCAASRYLSMGGVSMGIAGSIVDPAVLRELPRHARRDGRHDRVRPAAWTRASTTRTSTSARSPG